MKTRSRSEIEITVPGARHADTSSTGTADHPWEVLECSRGLVSVRAAWRERLGDHYPAFRAAFLQESSARAASYPCPRKCGCAHAVHLLERLPKEPSVKRLMGGQGQFVASCICEDDPDCEPVPLTEPDLVLWELSWAKIAQRLCRALQLRSQPAEFGMLNTRQIGAWSNDAVPVILTIQSERSHFRGAILELIARLRGKFILLAPTARHLDIVSKEMMARFGAGFFPLQRFASLGTDGAMVSREMPGVMFAAFSPQNVELEADAARRAFALIQQLGGGENPTVLRVFQLHCMESLSVRQVARRCHCSPTTVGNRLAVIREKTGIDPSQMRAYSNHLQEAAKGLEDSRARRIYRPSAIDEDAGEEM